MNNVSFDLLLGLVVALFFLYQYVMQRIRASRQQQRDAPDDLLTEPQEPANAAQWQWELPPASTVAPLVMPISAPERHPERREAPITRRRRRFSRDSLFGDRHRLQDAVVIAAIVGPCRAVEPHVIRQ
jgi:hypothetical protein